MVPRRRMLTGLASCLSLLRPWRAIHAAGLAATPPQTAGPFYPKTLPPDPNNDLIQIAGHNATARGVVIYLTGHIFDPAGQAVSGARVEIWQCDANGRYHHVRDDRADRPLDENFQGYGQTTTDGSGSYLFRTIRPVPYPGRTPHIHFAVSTPGWPRLVTQMYVAGEPGNPRDGILMSIRDPAARARLVVPLLPASGIDAAALTGTFDIVLDRG